MIGRPKTSAELRFWPKVNKNGNIPRHLPELGECWEWTGYITKKGYGLFRNIKHIHAHRFSYEIHNNCKLNDPLILVCHRCDNRKCVRPDHLFLGTSNDNIQDMVNKKRQASGLRHGRYTHPESIIRGENHHTRLRPETVCRGESNGSVKITSDIVSKIRDDHKSTNFTLNSLSKKYNISISQIFRIVKFKSWKHIPQ